MGEEQANDRAAQARKITRKIEKDTDISLAYTKKAIEHAEKAKEKVSGLGWEEKLAEESVKQAKRTAAESIKAGEARKEAARAHEETQRQMAKTEKSIAKAERRIKDKS